MRCRRLILDRVTVWGGGGGVGVGGEPNHGETLMWPRCSDFDQ